MFYCSNDIINSQYVIVFILFKFCFLESELAVKTFQRFKPKIRLKKFL